MTEEESKRFSLALAFSVDKHASQRRKDGSPYIMHPFKVAMLLAEQGYDVRYQIVGMLHDLLEDTDSTPDELSAFCDSEMLAAVRRLTRQKGISEADYIDSILQDPIAKAVKNADRIDNLTDLRISTNASFRERYLSETAQSFVDRFSKELDELYELLTGHFVITRWGQDILRSC